MHRVSFAALLCVGFICGAFALTTAADDEIKALPGWSGTDFKQYAGYVTVDEANDRKLFYWFVESKRAPATDDVVLWLNGGPGCSSIGGGLMTEQGPFRPQANGTVNANPWAWNNIANMIFLESPAGVGFSFSGVKSDYTVGDNRTAWDVQRFLTGFFDRYPQFADNKFWISGESYGGHYVPTATKAVVQGNDIARANGDRTINIQGFLVGNAWTDAPLDNTGAIEYWVSHRLISVDTYEQLKTCNMSEVGPLALNVAQERLPAITPDSSDCDLGQNQAFAEMGNINIYDIYAAVCVASSGRALEASDNPAGCAAEYQPCIGDWVTNYLNRQDVQEAIHANTSLPTKWSTCSSIVDYSRKDLLSSMLPVYRYLMDRPEKLNLLVFSGDVDAIVPVLGTVNWLQDLNLNISKPLRSWYTADKQVGGRITEYDGLTFTTVRGAGHMVPSTQPERGLYMFQHWIEQQPF